VPQLPDVRVRVSVALDPEGIVMLGVLNEKLLEVMHDGRFVAESVMVPVYPLRLVPVTVTRALFPVAIPIVGGEIDTV